MVGGEGDTIRLKASRGAQGALLQILQNKMLNKIKQIAKTTHVNNTKKRGGDENPCNVISI